MSDQVITDEDRAQLLQSMHACSRGSASYLPSPPSAQVLTLPATNEQLAKKAKNKKKNNKRKTTTTKTKTRKTNNYATISDDSEDYDNDEHMNSISSSESEYTGESDTDMRMIGGRYEHIHLPRPPIRKGLMRSAKAYRVHDDDDEKEDEDETYAGAEPTAGQSSYATASKVIPSPSINDDENDYDMNFDDAMRKAMEMNPNAIDPLEPAVQPNDEHKSTAIDTDWNMEPCTPQEQIECEGLGIEINELESRRLQRNHIRANSKMKFPIRPTRYANAMDEFTRQFQEAMKIDKGRRTVRTAEQVATEPNTTSFVLGDQRLRMLRWYLNNMGVRRSADQINFHLHFTIAILPLIYGDEWDAHSVRVMREFNINKITSEVLCMTPRRFGKSWAIAMFVLAVMLAVPGISLNVFSPGSRASSSLMKLVEKFANNIPGANQRICGRNKEMLYIAARPLPENVGTASLLAKQMQSRSDTSKLACFPSSKKGQLNVHERV